MVIRRKYILLHLHLVEIYESKIGVLRGQF